MMLPFQGQVAQMPQSAMGWMTHGGPWAPGAVQTWGPVGTGPSAFASAGGSPPCAPPLERAATLSMGGALPACGGVMLADCPFMAPVQQHQQQSRTDQAYQK